MTRARHIARVGSWAVLVCACLVPIVALLAAPFDPSEHTRTTATTARAAATTATTSTTLASSTTSTAAKAKPATTVEANDEGDATFVPGGPWRTGSTFYCLTGFTADGSGVADGIVAVSYQDWPNLRGTSWRVTDGPADLIGRVFTVHDKGPRAEFDMWTSDCAYARAYGRRTITVAPA